MKKLNFLSLLVVFVLLVNISLVYSNEIKDNFEIKIKSPIIVEIDDDYSIFPNDIKIRDDDNFEIYAGESIISKYNFENKLTYNLDVVFNLNKNNNLEELEDILTIYILDDVEDKSNCIINNGEIFKFNNEEVYIKQDSKKKYLCHYKEEQDLKLNLNIEENSVLSKYVLFVSKPKLKNNNEIEFNFNNNIEIIQDDLEVINLDNTNNNLNPNYNITDDLNNSFSNLNTNFNNLDSNSDFNKVKTDFIDLNKTKEKFEDIKQTTNNIKSGVTGLVTLNISNFSIILGGLIVVILLSLYIINRSNKNKEFKDLDSIN